VPAERVAPREAATVVLLRDGADGLQTWLLRRVAKMAFAPGMSVFPGGAVDPVDATGPQPSNLAAVAEQLGTTEQHAGVLLRAAAREIEEETDVRLPLESIRPWARWITPEAEPRRYDTYFFVAALPASSTASAVTGEASHADWIPVADALAEYARGDRPMLPPTVENLTGIARFGTVAEVLAAAARRIVRPIQPSFRQDEHGTWWADLGDGRQVELPESFRTASGRKLS
jgi:8-oxo-dGTP pyrophosphatase MutT (NUDIX family)